MYKLFFLIASFLTVVSSEGLRGRSMTSFLDENDEWKQFSNFQESFS